MTKGSLWECWIAEDITCKSDASWLGQALSWLHRWFVREYLMHLFDDADHHSDPILEIGLIWVSNHM